MFTGLIEELGTIIEISRGGSLRLGIRASKAIEELKLGDSVAVNGACLTVEEIGKDKFYASLLPETVALTTLGDLRQNDRVNLERPLRLGDRLGGHLVAGHVDGVAKVIGVQARGETRLVTLECPQGLERYLVEQGSVALEGVSLTVREPTGRRFSVSLVGTTLAATTLGELKVGDKVNVEADLLAKHIERLLTSKDRADSDKLVEWMAEAEPYE